MYSTYIFDLDGTLLDTLEDLANAVNYAMRKMNYPERSFGEVKSFIGDGMVKLIERSAPSGTDKTGLEKALSFFREYYASHLTDCTKPYEGIAEVIAELKKRGKKLAVVSNKADENSNTVVRHFFGDSFDIIVGKRDSFPAKPQPDSVLYVIDSLGSRKEECIFIGDSDIDVKTAHNAGLPCIGVTWGNRSRQELADGGAEYIADVAEDILHIK